MSAGARPSPQTTAGVLGLLVGGLVFFGTLLDGRFDLTRTAVAPGWFSNFYDLQARAFLDGRLDVPAGSLGIEGFVVDGRTYTYFAPLPSLVRIPVLLVTDAYDGRLTLLSMALGWSVFAAAVVGVVWATRRFFRGDLPVTRGEAVLAGIVIAAATGGTTLTYDAGLPWVYHEAYLWASATAVGGLYWLVRTLEEPSVRNGAWLGGFALAAIMSRIPAGWAVCGAALLTAGWLLTPGRRRRHGRLWATFLVAGAVPLAAGVAYNLARFHHPWLFPLQDQVWTSVNAHRREALAANGGSLTGPQFLPTSLVTYFRPDGIRFVDHFPWVTLPAEPARAYAGAFLDQTYRTGSVPAFMPLLFLLTAVAAVAVVLPRARHLRPLVAVLLGGIAVSAGVMGYGYLANRYVSDFVPGVVVGAAIGLWVVSGLVRDRPWTRRVVAAVLAVLAGFGLWANAATGHEVARTTWRGQPLVDYLDAQLATSSPSSVAARLTVGTGRPTGGSADDLFVAGDCDALYLNTGDAYEPWILVDRRPDVLVVSLPDRLTRERRTIGVVEGSSVRPVVLETQPPRRVRVTYTDAGVRFSGPWVEPYAGEDLRIGIGVDTSTGYARITTTPGGFVGSVPFTEWDADWDASPGTARWVVPDDGDLGDGVRATVERGRTPAVCERVLDAAGRG